MIEKNLITKISETFNKYINNNDLKIKELKLLIDQEIDQLRVDAI
jgi:hypothetical protein